MTDKTKGKVRVVSDGTPIGTVIYVDDIQMKNVTMIEFAPIIANENPVECKITFINVAFDIAAKVVE